MQTSKSAGDTVEERAPAQVGYVQIVTLVLLAALAIGTVVFDLDVGFLSVVLAVTLRLATYRSYPDAVGKVSWSTVLLICGVITYVGVLQAAGTIDYVSGGITSLGAPLLAALLCYLGGVLSAFASSVGILGVAIPLAVPFLQQGDVSPIGMVAALAVATTIVDVSPFSTNGALVLANAPADIDKDRFYRQMLLYSAIVVALGPLLAWLLLVVPGWL